MEMKKQTIQITRTYPQLLEREVQEAIHLVNEEIRIKGVSIALYPFYGTCMRQRIPLDR